VRIGQKGRLRVTVASANGKEVTTALVGAGEFFGETSKVSAHPLRLEAATAMTACALLRVSDLFQLHFQIDDERFHTLLQSALFNAVST